MVNNILSAPFEYYDRSLGCSLDKKIWNIRKDTGIAHANPPSCPLCCLAIPCEEVPHPCPVGVVIYHLPGTGRVRRIGSDLVLDTRPAGTHSVKKESARLDGEYFYKLQGRDTGLGQLKLGGVLEMNVRSGRAIMVSKILWQWFGSGPGPPLLAEKQACILFNPLILIFCLIIATHRCATRPTLWNPPLVYPTTGE